MYKFQVSPQTESSRPLRKPVSISAANQNLLLVMLIKVKDLVLHNPLDMVFRTDFAHEAEQHFSGFSLVWQTTFSSSIAIAEISFAQR